jgi:hypothetical protein
MRTIGRILVILLAALVVVGAIGALVNNGLIAGQGSSGREGERPHFGTLEDGDGQGRAIGQRPEGDFGEREGGRGESGGSFLPGLLKNLGVIALIVALVVLAQKFWSRVPGQREKSPDHNQTYTLVEKAPPADS